MKKRQRTKVLSLQEIAKNFSVSYQTLNYYTSLGLLHSQRRQGNKRLYKAREVKRRLQKINKLKNEGYPLRIISNIINNKRNSMHI